MKQHTQSELEVLKTQFNSLNTIDEKLNFWRENFSSRFMFWENFPQSEYSDFFVNSSNPNEIEYINQHNLSEYLEVIAISPKQHFTRYQQGVKVDSIHTAEKLEVLFNEQLQDAINRKMLIQREIDKVSKHVSEYEKLNHNPKEYHFGIGFNHAFNDYLYNRKSPDYSSRVLPLSMLTGYYYGCELAKYRLRLEELLDDKQVAKVIDKELSVSMPQQILTLEYLGIIKTLSDKLNSREDLFAVLSLITGKSKTNIKKELNKKLSDRVLQKSNKDFLSKLRVEFDKMELSIEAKRIKEDCNKQ